MQLCGIKDELVQDVNWSRDVETSASYTNAVNYVKHLYQTNDEFRKDIQDNAHPALVTLKKSREKYMKEKNTQNTEIDLEEGIEYPLKELAFLSAIGDIYEGCEEVVVIYHKPWSLVEKYCDGIYDGIPRSGFGFYLLE